MLKTQIVGNIAADPDLRYSANGTAVLRVLIAGCAPQALVIVYLGIERVRGRARRIVVRPSPVRPTTSARAPASPSNVRPLPPMRRSFMSGSATRN